MNIEEQVIEGVGASPGIAIGHAFVFKKTNYEAADEPVLTAGDIEYEIVKFQRAVNQAIDDVESLIQASRNTLTETERDLLEVQVEMLSDPQLNGDVVKRIHTNHEPATAAVWHVSEELIRVMGGLDNEYLRARAADVRGCAAHILRHLKGETNVSLRDVPAHSVIVAEDISPLEALTIDLKQIAGIVTRLGGSTSHAAILARARNIPAVVACGEALERIEPGDLVIADGTTGRVWSNPPYAIHDAYVQKRKAFDDERQSLRSIAAKNATTIDGREIRLMANISGADDMSAALSNGAEGAGLFRTELLFMKGTRFPTENEQFEAYREVAQIAGRYPVTVRTLDIGGDKPLSYFELPHEENPFLGYRAIRISLQEVDRFQEQLRAILRASAFGNLRVMFPMIGSVSEIRHAKALLEAAKAQLRADGIPFNDSLPVGVMIETPAAAVIADLLAKEVDFFSIGTNDLCQYTLAVDRGNEKIKKLYEPFHPAVLRLIANTVEQAAKNNIEVSMCGEMAGDVRATLLLVGMGLRSLSMIPTNIPYVKRAIREGLHVRALQIASDVLDMSDAGHIREYLNEEALNRNT